MAWLRACGGGSDTSKLVLYDNGQTMYQWVSTCASDKSPYYVVFSNTDRLHIKNQNMGTGGYSNAAWVTAQKIDITEYKTLKFEGSLFVNTWIQCGLTDKTGTYNQYCIQDVTTNIKDTSLYYTDERTVSSFIMDISAYTGSWHIFIQARNCTSSVSISKVTLFK